MAVVDTNTSTLATAWSSQRKVARTSAGRLWIAFYNGADTELWYTDDGATFAQNTSATIVGAVNGSLFIDIDDHAHFVYANSTPDVFYRRMASIGTATSWSAATTLATSPRNFPDVVAHREGTGWAVHCVWGGHTSGANLFTEYRRITVASDGTISAGSTTSVFSAGTTASGASYPSIDFNHTGDAKTVAGSTPHLYVVATHYDAAFLTAFRKATYSAGSWTWDTIRTLDASYANSGRRSMIFDGARVVAAWSPVGSTAAIYVRERDAADTTTTSRTPTSLADGTILGVSVTYDGDGNIHMWAAGETSADVKRIIYDRTADAWDTAWTTVAATDMLADTLSLKRGYSHARIDAVYTKSAASWYDVTYAAFAINQPPNAPTPTNPVGGAVIDRTVTNRFAWDFNDPDAGDSQSQYELRYRLVGASTWTTVGPNATPNTFHDFAAAHFAAGDYEWQARTWDEQGEVGPWSASEFFTAADPPPSPSITDPISGQTIPSQNYTVHWSAPSQDGGYEWRRVADNAGSPDTTIVYDGSMSPSTTARSRSISFPVNDRWEHVQWRIKDGGLWSQWASVRVEVSYTPPGIPHVRVTSDVDHLTVRVYNSTAWGYGGTGAAKNAASPPLIDLDALGVGQVLWLPGAAGNYASTPDDASLDITGDIDLRAEVALEDWTPGAEHELVAKWGSSSSSSYLLRVRTDGKVQLTWSTTGSDGTNVVSTAATGVSDGAKGFVRATLNVDNSAANDGTGVWEVRFYTWDGTQWVQLGAAVTGAATTTIFAGTAPLQVSGRDASNGMLKGKVLRAQVRNGIDGTLVADFNAADFTAPGTTAVDSTGKTWTINRSGDATAEIVDRNTWAFTGSEYLTLPDRDDLDFGAGEDFALIVSTLSRGTTWLLSKNGGAAGPRYLLRRSATLATINLGPSFGLNASIADSARWNTVAASRGGTDVTLRVNDGTPSTGTNSDDLQNAEPLLVAGTSPRGLTDRIVIFRRTLTAAEHTELAGWDGTVATEPTWLRDEATLYVNADDPVQRTQYTARNLTLNLARTTDEGGVASDLPPVTANRVRRQRLDGTTWVDDPAGYLDLNGSPTIPADSDHPDWAVAHQADYRYEVEAVGDNDTSSRSGWVG